MLILPVTLTVLSYQMMSYTALVRLGISGVLFFGSYAAATLLLRRTFVHNIRQTICNFKVLVPGGVRLQARGGQH